jgi:hypothetical protein
VAPLTQCSGFPLSRHLCKMVAYHSSIEQLCKFAHSPRLYMTLQSPLVVVRINPSQLPAVLFSEGDVRLVTKKAFDQTVFVQEWPDEPSSELTERYMESMETVEKLFAKQKAHIHHTTAPHAEQTLLFNHIKEDIRSTTVEYNNKNPVIAPFSYVAVSKLSCLLCSTVFDAFRRCRENDNGGLNLWVRGCHSKLYYPWQPPTIEFSESSELNHLIPAALVREALWGTLVRIYSAWLAKRNDIRVRTFSDSTNQSGTEQNFGPNDDEEQEAFAEADRKLQAWNAEMDQA